MPKGIITFSPIHKDIVPVGLYLVRVIQVLYEWSVDGLPSHCDKGIVLYAVLARGRHSFFEAY